MNRHGWARKRIGELCDFSGGYGFKPSDWSKSGLPIIRIQNLNGSPEFNYYAGKPEDDWLVQPGQLLFAWAGTRGVSFGPTMWKGPLGVLNQHIYRIHPKAGVNKDWLYLALRVVTGGIEGKAHGFKSTLVHVRKSDIVGEVVWMPDEETQERIAVIVQCWEEMGALLARRVEVAIERKGGLLRDLMDGRRRFKEFRHNRWQRRSLGDFLTESRVQGSGGHVARKLSVKLYSRGVCVRVDGRVGSERTRYYRRRAGQFIYSKLDFLNGAFGVIPPDLDGFESTQDLPAFDIDEGVHARWLLYNLGRPEFYRNQRCLASGGRKAKRVNPSGLLEVEIPVPEVMEQRRVAEVLECCDWEIDLLEKQLEAVREQKRGLMQKLLTGEIRVKV